jgi:DNA replication protein DnaC
MHERQPYPLFLPSSEFFLQLKDTFGNNKISEQDIIQQYDRSPLLVIDDVGSEKISDWSRQMFYVLIDRRYRNKKQTIITSNLNLKQISELIDDRISSRIVGMGKVVEFFGEDYRLR